MQGNASPAVIWQCVKQSNSYMRKSKQARHTTILSAEKGNLYNVHSYKFSGLANPGRAVDVSTSADGSTIQFSKPVKKSQQQPAKAATSYVLTKQNPRRQLVTIGKAVGSVRADLKRPAQARLAALQKSLRVKKALSKSA